MDKITSFRGKYGFLSSFWGAQIWPHWLPLPAASVEHAYQATKTELRDEQVRILLPGVSAGEAKRMGRKVVVRRGFDGLKLEIMSALVEMKFTDHKDLGKRLLDTGDAELVEGNYWHDQYWGDCNCRKHMYVPGENNLGKILMKAREQLKVP